MTGSLRAVETLYQVDPEFEQLVEVIYGEALDPEILWADVFGKRAPQQDPRQKRDRIERQVAQASNLVGLAAGVAGTGAAVHQYKNARREAQGLPPLEHKPGSVKQKIGRLIPAGMKTKRAAVIGTGAALGLQGANIAGDVVAARVLNRDAKKAKQTAMKRDWEPFEKATVPQLVRGLLRRTQPAATGGTVPASSAGNVATSADPVQAARYQRKAAKGTLRRQQQSVQSQTRRSLSQADQAPNVVARAGGDVSGRVGELRAAREARQASKPVPIQPMTFSQIGNSVKTGVQNNPGKTALAAGTVGTGALLMRRKPKEQSADPYSYGMAVKNDGVTFAGEFSKLDVDKRLAFGWASVVEKNGLPVVDRQGDYIAPEDMEEAAYVYVQKSRVGGNMHKRSPDDRPVHVSDLVESVVFTREKIEKMGLPHDTPIGWWVGFKIHDDDTWESVKKGAHTGFSIHGRGRRHETSVDELHKYHR